MDLLCRPRLMKDPSVLQQSTDLTVFDLRTDLSCPICMGILQHAVVVKDCLHRFCTDCIEKCVRIGIRECPQCRIHIASRRSLRPDALFDSIIHRLFPDVKEFEEKNEELVAEANRRRTAVGSSEDDLLDDLDVDEGEPKSTVIPPRAVYMTVEGNAVCRDGTSGSRGSSSTRGDSPLSQSGRGSCLLRRRRRRDHLVMLRKYPTDGRLRYIFLPDPTIPLLPWLNTTFQQRFITRGHLSVRQLCHFLRCQLGLGAGVELNLYTKQHRSTVSSDTTLAQLSQLSLAFSHDTLVVYYTTKQPGDCSGGVYRGQKGYIVPRELLMDAPASVQEGGGTTPDDQIMR
eukprot:GHVS01081133.1.p1 GENE.GHVS01081133.1~~GHVS01081133.1.p1  ORF type:complete len:394 (+),score=60.60 GHVS01081133.1:156-1184(+)